MPRSRDRRGRQKQEGDEADRHDERRTHDPGGPSGHAQRDRLAEMNSPLRGSATAPVGYPRAIGVDGLGRIRTGGFAV